MTAEPEQRRHLADRAFAWFWRRRARRARDPAAFRRLVLRRRAVLDALAARAEAALAAPPVETGAAGWRWRPDILTEQQSPSIWRDPASGARPAPGLTVFHDAAGGAFMLAQRSTRGDGARFELFFEAYAFPGAYLSLAFAPPPQLRRPEAGEMIVAEADIAASRPIKLFARLNLASARASDALHAEGVASDGRVRFGFDIAFAAFEPQAGDRLWLDLIFDRPRMADFAMRDLTVSLTPRDTA